MYQVLFEIPGTGIQVFGFGLMLFLAFLGGMQLSAWRAKRSKLDPEIIYDLAFWLILSGLLGARLFYVVQYRENLESFWDIFKIWKGGIVYYGSVLGGAAGFFLYWTWRRFPIRPTLDAVAPGIALGTALGRIGCFLNGCCYGDICQLPWAVRFPAGTLPWHHHVDHGLIPTTAAASLAVHPTQLYSALDGLILMALLLAYYPLRRRDGEVMALLAVTYPISRFLIEALRDDEGVFFAGLTISQTLSLPILAIGVLFWIGLSRLPRGRFEDHVGR